MLGSPFDCDSCGDLGFCEYDVTFTDLHKEELCESCLEMFEKDGIVLMSSRFVGLK
jgi:hypothetical protein